MTARQIDDLKLFLDRKAAEYNAVSFIKSDPICIPHSFTQRQDIEIAAFFAAIMAWGNRTTIINKCNELMAIMEHQPYAFCLNPPKEGLQRVLNFKHRTFNPTDILYFIEFFHHHYQHHNSLEIAFTNGIDADAFTVETGLRNFYRYMFSLPDAPKRTFKHIATPDKKSTCKRLNMFLRWMVRRDDCGVDFGIWQTIQPSQLICPIDVHVARVARRFNLLTREQTDWLSAVELTKNLRTLDAADPVKYDFALFALGVMEKY